MIQGFFEIIDGEDFLMKTATPEEASKHFEKWESDRLKELDKFGEEYVNSLEEEE